MSTTSAKLIVLGLDGASWRILNPLLNSGIMPNLKSLISKGAFSVLNSTLPPVSGSVWPVIATGLNPGKLGAYDFYNRLNLDDFSLYPVRSHMIKGRTFWDYFSKKGYRIGVFGYPLLIPAYEINGWMVAGLGGSSLQKWAWPRRVQDQINKIAGPFSFTVSYGRSKYKNNLPRLISDIWSYYLGQISALEYLLDMYPVDILITVFGVTDFICHTMWHIWDQTHPLYDHKLSAEFMPHVLELWSEIDRGIGKILKNLSPAGHIICLSDHGFGKSFGVFHTNTWLESNGFLRREIPSTRLNNKIRLEILNKLPSELYPILGYLAGTQIQQSLRASILREIDLINSKAFALETTDIFGMIFINRQYAIHRNFDEEEFVESTVCEICDLLEQFGEIKNLEIVAFPSKSIYQGVYSRLAPEVLFQVKESQISVSYRFSDSIYDDRQHLPMKTGTHRLEGIFIGSGPKFKLNKSLESQLSVLDVTPTLYHLLDEPIPANLDGHIALDAILPEFHSYTIKDYGEDFLLPDGIKDLPVKMDDGNMKKRLRDLGYLD